MDYKNGKIYQITDIAYTKMYIGSTTQPLSKRFSGHKSKYNKWKEGLHHKVSIFDIFDEFGIENCKIELIEEYECENKSQLERKEGEYIKNNDCVNKRIEGRTKKQYYQDNKDQIAEYKKQYHQDNKVQIIEKAKQFYQDNKEQILGKKKQIINCDCGLSYATGNKSRHLKSKRHIDNIN
jgi:hypothetical protein